MKPPTKPENWTKHPMAHLVYSTNGNRFMGLIMNTTWGHLSPGTQKITRNLIRSKVREVRAAGVP